MIYTVEGKTRWNDTDATLCVRPSQLLVYMQESAWQQMDSAGQNLDRLREEEGLAFILTRLSLRFAAPLGPFERVFADTWIGEERGFSFPRYFRLRNAAGEVVARAATDWALIRLSDRHPLRAGEFRYKVEPDEPLDFTTPRRYLKSEGTNEVGARRIVYSDADYNGHMNNTRYPDLLCDHLPIDIVPHVRVMNMSFLREAPLGATIRVLRGERNDEGRRSFYFRTLNEADKLCLEAEVLTDLPVGEDSPCR